MNLYWIVVATVNLVLGVAAGWYLRQWLEPQFPLPSRPRRKRAAEPEPDPGGKEAPADVSAAGTDAPDSADVPTPTEAAASPFAEEPEAMAAPSDDALAQEMNQRFQAVSNQEELVLCTTSILEEQSRRFLEQLVQAETQSYHLLQTPDVERLQQVLDVLEESGRQWLAVQQGVLERMKTHASVADSARIEHLEHILLDQAAQIETAWNNLRMISAGEDPGARAERLQQEIKALIRRLHGLLEQTASVALDAFVPQALEVPDVEELLTDRFTGLPTRTGLCHLVDQWRVEDPHSMRQASVVLVGVDEMSRWNDQLGTRVGDWLLQTLAQAFPQALRQERGFDRVGYYGGDRFLVFLGDASPHNASVVAERIRQSVEEGEFLAPSGPVALRVSCGVAECLPGDSFQATCLRAEETLRYAKEHGRNCTAIHDGTQTGVVQAPPLKILHWRFDFAAQEVGQESAAVPG